MYMFHDMVIPTGEGPDCEYMNPSFLQAENTTGNVHHALLSLMAIVKQWEMLNLGLQSFPMVNCLYNARFIC